MTKDRVEVIAKQRYQKDISPWLSPEILCENPWIQLHNEIIKFYQFYGPCESEDRIRKDFYFRVRDQIKKVWPYAKIKIFGSTASRLYLPQSDLDVVVFLPKSKVDDLKLVKTLQNKLSKLAWTRSCESIGAKVPIVKLEDTVSGLFMDISFNK